MNDTRYRSNHDIFLITIFRCASAKAEHDLSNLSGMFLYVELGDPPGNGIFTGNSLISSLDLDSPQKFSL